jgi:hypothetical protein
MAAPSPAPGKGYCSDLRSRRYGTGGHPPSNNRPGGGRAPHTRGSVRFPSIPHAGTGQTIAQYRWPLGHTHPDKSRNPYTAPDLAGIGSEHQSCRTPGQSNRAEKGIRPLRSDIGSNLPGGGAPSASSPTRPVSLAPSSAIPPKVPRRKWRRLIWTSPASCNASNTVSAHSSRGTALMPMVAKSRLIKSSFN